MNTPGKMAASLMGAMLEACDANDQGLEWMARKLGVSLAELERMASEKGTVEEWSRIAAFCGSDLGMLIADPVELGRREEAAAEMAVGQAEAARSAGLTAMAFFRGQAMLAASEEEFDRMYFLVQDRLHPWKGGPGIPLLASVLDAEGRVHKARTAEELADISLRLAKE